MSSGPKSNNNNLFKIIVVFHSNSKNELWPSLHRRTDYFWSHPKLSWARATLIPTSITEKDKITKRKTHSQINHKAAHVAILLQTFSISSISNTPQITLQTISSISRKHGNWRPKATSFPISLLRNAHFATKLEDFTHTAIYHINAPLSSALKTLLEWWFKTT